MKFNSLLKIERHNDVRLTPDRTRDASSVIEPGLGQTGPSSPGTRTFFEVALAALASPKLLGLLLTALVAGLWGARWLEASNGREFAQWYVYGSPWFAILLTLLGLNSVLAILIRQPWKKLQPDFLLAHAGLLVLLAGAMLTIGLGVEGQLSLREGESCDELLVTGRSVLTATRLADGGQVATDFSFAPGPADWPEGKSLDLGQDGGFGLKIVKFYRHAGERVDWVADSRDTDGPALELSLRGPSGGLVDQDWLAAGLFGGEAVIGPTLYQLWPLPTATMVEDFLHPPSGPGDQTLGTLSIHHAGKMYRVPVQGNVGKRVPLGETGIEVELVACFPDARPKLAGGFFSRSNQPRNPLLELKITFPDRAEPVRQIAFAKSPLVNLDGVHGSICPVRFWYHHPQLKRTPGAVFAQSPEGKLWCRAVIDDRYREAEPVAGGSQVPLGGGFRILVLNHIPRARRQVSFSPIAATDRDGATANSAALIEVTVGGTRREVWLQREDPRNGTQTISTDHGPLGLSFAYQRLPLGCQLHLDDFVHAPDPGESGAASFTSHVRLTDPVTRFEQQREISLDRPLQVGRFTLKQTSQQQLAHGVETSTLTAVYDPGRSLKFLGSVLLCAGIGVMVFRRAIGALRRCDNLPQVAEVVGCERAA